MTLEIFRTLPLFFAQVSPILWDCAPLISLGILVMGVGLLLDRAGFKSDVCGIPIWVYGEVFSVLVFAISAGAEETLAVLIVCLVTSIARQEGRAPGASWTKEAVTPDLRQPRPR